MRENKNNEVTKVLDTLAEDPSRMNEMLGGNTETVVRSILNDGKLSDAEISGIAKQVSENNVMKLYLGADGQIDAANLMKLTGGFTGAKADEATRASGIGALLDGKLDANDVIAVMNMLSSSNSTSSASANSGLGLLGSLLGGSQQTAQTQTQQTGGLGSLLGALSGNTQQTQTAQAVPSAASVTLSGMQLAQIMQMFTKEQLKITQSQAKQEVTLNQTQLKQMIAQLGGKVYTSSKQTVTLTGLQLAQIMMMLGSGTVQITQAQAKQNITLNAKQMEQMMNSLNGTQTQTAQAQQTGGLGSLLGALSGQAKPAQTASQQTAAQNNDAGQVFSFGNNTASQAQSSQSSGDLGSLLSLASLLMGKK